MDIKLLILVLENNKKGTVVPPVRTMIKIGTFKIGTVKIGEMR